MGYNIDMDKIEQALHDKNYVLFESHSPIVPEWQDFIDNMNQSFNSFKEKSEDSRWACESILLLNKFDPVIFGSLMLEDTKLFSSTKRTILDIESMTGLNLSRAKSILNFVAKEHDYYIHKDEHNVLSWQCIGSVEYRLYKNIDDLDLEKAESSSTYESVILNPGDIIFLPAGLAHQVVVTEPRATLVFAIGEK
jgi:hypothetical protein